MNDLPTRAGAAPVIALDNVHKRFGSVVAVDGAHFDVPRGQFFSLLGPSGCGKTTMLRMIAGFEDVTSGRICLDGVDVTNVPPYRRNVNTVFQHYALFPHLSVWDNVAFGPRTKGLDKQETERRVGAMLEVVRLGELASRRPEQLSGGQRQRVALARALVNFPSALLLDEPLSALDLKLRQAMQMELKRIHREVGISFVFVTHDQEEALTMSERIAVMNEGRIEQVGTPQDIYHAPASVFVAGFIGSANLLPATVESVHGDRATVLLAGGRRAEVSIGPTRFAPSDSAILMVRPERIRLTAGEAVDRANSVPVTLQEIIFQGPVLRFVVRDCADRELLVDLDGQDRRPVVEPGAALYASWEPTAARLLPPRS